MSKKTQNRQQNKPNEYKQRRAQAQRMRELESRGELPQPQAQTVTEPNEKPKTSKLTILTLVMAVAGAILHFASPQLAIAGFTLCLLSFIVGVINLGMERHKKTSTKSAWKVLGAAVIAGLLCAMTATW
ncbi:hypothetical protein D2E26_1274 [Bifidobacterium dolichotidis]|uniref:Uncharacterized protein n=1 Tax=Bifidobacterium dolichotidis TaxID=2306976 RepID=A0A430FQX2_9BIFI|nr:hypothetical protein [Bifidobacterium dolichotidis]RSX55220.1 hypothetical protein D2E26_1274 [Bifidobacterium dolichotidis]